MTIKRWFALPLYRLGADLQRPWMGITCTNIWLHQIFVEDVKARDLSRSIQANVSLEIGNWSFHITEASAIGLLQPIWWATLDALIDRRARTFWALDGEIEGRIEPAAGDQVRVVVGAQTHQISGLELVRELTDAMLRLADWLAAEGYPEAATQLIVPELLGNRRAAFGQR